MANSVSRDRLGVIAYLIARIIVLGVPVLSSLAQDRLDFRANSQFINKTTYEIYTIIPKDFRLRSIHADDKADTITVVTKDAEQPLLVTAIAAVIPPTASADSVRKPNGSAQLAITIQVIDSETKEPVPGGKLSVTDQTQQTLIPVFDSLNQQFSVSVVPGTSLAVLASASDYVSAKIQLANLNASRRITMKLMKLKPTVLTIKVFSMSIRQPLASAVVSITSRITGKAERFELPTGRLERIFTTSDDLDIQVSAAGYTSINRRLAIDVPLSGKLYEFDAELDKITLGLTIRAVDNQTGKAVSGATFTLSGPTGTPPVPVKIDFATGLATATIPGKGTYQLTSVAPGYEDFTRSIVLDKEQNEVLVKLSAKSPATAEKTVLSEAQPTDKAAVETAALSVPSVTTKTFGVIEKGKSIRLNKIYFDQSSPVLRPESYTELNQLFDVLSKYPSLRIEIRGHTDNQGDFDLNTQLSRDRCQAVVDYLAGKGIRKNRLQAVGRGSLDPVAPNNNEENRKKNRRVEFMVL
ncbi:OmpA family protein [Spirosoma endbachense]|uniref:OmpA family protein n=1 Tax=Spirosoma endbachense TaxID=2666025 RepID=A0A6P1VYH1_9BACT|nr:OmpA family protein [Spirosoma endbachense]QHV97358.1 OmpA family protein [Spirosoma endbachense]